MADSPTSETCHPTRSEPAAIANDRVELFVRLIGLHQYQVHRYLLSLVPNPDEADDLYQQTNLFLWREFDRFEEGTNFVSWACAVAYHEVLAWRKRKSREKLVFCEDFLSTVSAELVTHAERIELRSQALVRCVEKLPAHHRELIELRYGNQQQVEEISQQTGRTVEAIYRMLSRIRRCLQECVTRTLELEMQ